MVGCGESVVVRNSRLMNTILNEIEKPNLSVLFLKSRNYCVINVHFLSSKTI